MNTLQALLVQLRACWQDCAQSTRMTISIVLLFSYGFIFFLCWGQWLGLLITLVIYTVGMALVVLLFGWLILVRTTIEYCDFENLRTAIVLSNQPFVVKTPDGNAYASDFETNHRPWPLRRVTYCVYLSLTPGEEVEVLQ